MYCLKVQLRLKFVVIKTELRCLQNITYTHSFVVQRIKEGGLIWNIKFTLKH